MPTATDERPFEDLSVEESNARLRRMLDKIDAEASRPPVKPVRIGRAHTPRTKRKLSQAVYQRRKREALATDPSAVARLRLARDWSQRQAAERALISTRTWARAEANIASVHGASQRRVAAALGVDPADLH